MRWDWRTFSIVKLAMKENLTKGILKDYHKWIEVSQSCQTLCDPMDCSLPCSSVHWIFQARVLEWAAISFSRGSSWPRDQTWVSHIVGICLTVRATREGILKGYHKGWVKWKLELICHLMWFSLTIVISPSVAEI